MKTVPMLLLLLFILVVTPAAQAQTPETFAYQGFLLGADGTPVAGTVNLSFSLYDAATDGTALWQEDQIEVPVAEGVFTVQLGSRTSWEALSFDGPLWLGVRVNGGAELAPRVALSAVPYSLRAGSLAEEALQAGENVSITRDGVALVISAMGGSAGWQLGGNSGTTASTDFIGTTDGEPFEIRVDGSRVMRYEPAADTTAEGPNVLGGWSGNSVAEGVVGATIGGGGDPDSAGNPNPNQVTADYGTIGGGQDNTASGTHATVGGGWNNTSGDLATIGGGISNTASGTQATIGGGTNNTASSLVATVGGGNNNTARGAGATVGGGAENTTGDDFSTVAGGLKNRAGGQWATVPGGAHNQARGLASFAAGFRARAAHDGTFVWGSRVRTSDSLVSTADYQFLIEAAGGVGIGTNRPRATVHIAAEAGPQVQPLLLLEELGSATTTRLRMKKRSSFHHWDIAALVADNTQRLFFYASQPNINLMTLSATGDPLVMHNGAKLTEGGAWTNASSRQLKTDFAAVDGEAVLAGLAQMPVETWRYKTEVGVRHMGPTAEAFAEAFGLGDTDQAIATVDADGVALAAIQALYERVQALYERVQAQDNLIKVLVRRLEALERRQP